jgi:hypothetical protein
VGDDPAAVAANRAIVARELGVAAADVAVMQAAHGNDVAVVGAGGVVPQVDGLVTSAPGVALLALAADCATVALVDRGAGLIGAVHSGWRGVVANAVGAVVTRMVVEGAQMHRIEAAIGPAICPACYEVSDQVRQEVAAAAPTAAAYTRRGTPAVDVRAGVREQLRSLGVTQVSTDPTCTFESQELFSFRRDGVTGRHGMMIALRPEPSEGVKAGQGAHLASNGAS